MSYDIRWLDGDCPIIQFDWKNEFWGQDGGGLFPPITYLLPRMDPQNVPYSPIDTQHTSVGVRRLNDHVAMVFYRKNVPVPGGGTYDMWQYMRVAFVCRGLYDWDPPIIHGPTTIYSFLRDHQWYSLNGFYCTYAPYVSGCGDAVFMFKLWWQTGVEHVGTGGRVARWLAGCVYNENQKIVEGIVFNGLDFTPWQWIGLANGEPYQGWDHRLCYGYAFNGWGSIGSTGLTPNPLMYSHPITRNIGGGSSCTLPVGNYIVHSKPSNVSGVPYRIAYQIVTTYNPVNEKDESRVILATDSDPKNHTRVTTHGSAWDYTGFSTIVSGNDKRYGTFNASNQPPWHKTGLSSTSVDPWYHYPEMNLASGQWLQGTTGSGFKMLLAYASGRMGFFTYGQSGPMEINGIYYPYHPTSGEIIVLSPILRFHIYTEDGELRAKQV